MKLPDFVFKDGVAHVRRPFKRPYGRKWPEFILGRRRNLRFLEENGWLIVSCYDTHKYGPSRPFYTDPCHPVIRTKNPKVRYRIKVRLK